MTVLLKIHASDKIFDKICLKAIRDTFFSNMSLWSGDRGNQFFSAGDIRQKEKVQAFWHAGRPPKFPPLVGYLDLLIRKTLKWVLDPLTLMIFKGVKRVYSFRWMNLQHVCLQKRWQILWWHSIYWRLSIHFKVRII